MITIGKQKMKEKNTDKIYTYTVLAVGILIWAFYFYGAYRYAQGILTSRFHSTNYARYFRNDFFDNTTTWILLQVLFLYSWWSLRSCIVSVFKKIHSKI